MITEINDQILQTLQMLEECKKPVPLKTDDFPAVETDRQYPDRYGCEMSDSKLKACVMPPDPLDERRKIQ